MNDKSRSPVSTYDTEPGEKNVEVSRFIELPATNTEALPLDSDGKELLLKMYDTLRKEVENFISELRARLKSTTHEH